MNLIRIALGGIAIVMFIAGIIGIICFATEVYSGAAGIAISVVAVVIGFVLGIVTIGFDFMADMCSAVGDTLVWV